MNKPENYVCGPDSCSPAADLIANETSEKPLELLVFSDFICPWCLVGKTRLESALALAPERSVSVKWMPFELNPNMPAEGLDRKTYRSAKFASWAQSQALDAQVENAAKAEGLEFRHDLIERTPNTRAAHRLTWLADQQGKQNAVATAVLRAYFLEGRDVGQPEVLADIAAEQGMDRASTLEALRSDAGNTEVEALLAEGRKLGISGVPAVVRDGELLFSGAQDPRAIAVALFGNSFGAV